tara:strand:+ start:6433 stop:7602 length:1170 start_codon:yes stop_codon:yes gene_type:complete
MPADARSREWIERLIGFDTVSSKSNLTLIRELKDYLDHHGLVTRQTYNDASTKANLFATIPGAGSRLRGGVVFSGHTDVVPAEGQDWSSDPFRAEVRDRRIYGRGSCDMKGFIGVVLAAVPSLIDLKASRPIHFAFSYDEELGCLGAPAMIADIMAAGLNPDACIVGEPTGMQPVAAHKGLCHYRCQVHGRSAHSSRTSEGVNAIEYAASIILAFKQLMSRNASQSAAHSEFDIPFTTGNIGMIKGGTASNIVAEHCEFHFDCRPMPDFDVEALERQLQEYIRFELLPRMQDVDAASTVVIEKLVSVPSLSDTDNADLIHAAMRMTGADRPRKVAFATEAGQFSTVGIPTIVCGPGHIEHAHRADEYVSFEQINLCENFVAEMAAAFAT